MVESQTRNRKVTSSSLRSGMNCRWHFLLLQYHDEVPLSKALNLNCSPGAAAIWLPNAPGVCSWVCVFTAVCVHLGWINPLTRTITPV